MNRFNTDTIRTNIDAFRHFVAERSGKPTDDHGWPSRLIYFYMKQSRSSVIFQNDLMRVYDMGDDQLDNLGCVELVEADMVECPCAPASGCLFLKSKHPIPKMIDGQMMSVKLPLGGRGQLTNINYVPWHRFDNKINGRIKAQARKPYYTVKKNKDGEYYLYVYNKVALKTVFVSGIFSDPIDVAIFPNCGDEENNKYCNVLDLPFPIKEELKPQVFQMTLASLVNTRSSAPVGDNDNDDKDSTSYPPKQTN